MAIKIYKGMILPYFDYGDVVYMGGRKDMLEKLQRLQNRALKICLRVEHRHPTDDLHRQTRVKTLYDRRKAHLKIAAFSKIRNPGRVQVTEKITRGGDAPRLIIN